MSASVWKWDWDYVWHDLGGIGINGLLVVLPLAFLSGPAAAAWGTPTVPLAWLIPFGMVPLLTVGGLLRECVQHHWEPLTPHQILEGVLWGVGSLKAALVGLIWLL